MALPLLVMGGVVIVFGLIWWLGSSFKVVTNGWPLRATQRTSMRRNNALLADGFSSLRWRMPGG
jgi:hypothetical protein